MRSKRHPAAAALAALAAVLLLAEPVAAPDAVETPSQLELRLELARSDRFYMELDPDTSELRLLFGGVVLKTYPVLSMARATPRLAFLPLGGTLPFTHRLWANGTLDPHRPEVRLEIQPPDDDADSAAAPPPLPPHFEDMHVPGSFRLRFEPHMVLAISSPRPPVSKSFLATLGSVWDKLVEARDAALDRRSRLHLTLERADAEHLYRSLPPDTQLIVLSPSDT